jgi:hypothetical protein
MGRTIVVIVACASAVGAVDAAPRAIDPKLGCRNNPALAEGCFEIDGHVVVSNGTPSVRLYRRDMNRVLGIVGGEEPMLPECLTEVLSFEKKVDGKFVVCPFSRDRPGHMQMVCIDEVVNARVFDSGTGGRWREVGRLKNCRIQDPSK